MRLDHCTWQEVEAYLAHSEGIMLATGSTEQHGPMGLIGTDTICAEAIVERAASQADALFAPPVGYTPAPFNMAFPGTISVSEELFEELIAQILAGLRHHGFRYFYILNGHGANLEALHRIARTRENVRIRSWWDFDRVNAIRQEAFGDWEGMHATPSEIAITQALHRSVDPGDATTPPARLSRAFMRAHSGDKHGPPEEHRRDFPDGRVGSHSALATPEIGQCLLDAAVASVVEDYKSWLSMSVA